MGSMAVCTGSVGASGSSPACLQDRGHSGFSIACGGGRPSSRPYSYAIHCAVRLRNGLHEVYTGSVGASGSSPACLQDRGHSGFSIACGGGRPSSRPYSYAIHCAVRLRNGLHEVYTGSVGASGSSPACLQDRGHFGFSIACSAGDLPVAPTATRYTARWVAVMPMGSMAVYTGSVGASGSSPACLQDRGHFGFSIACSAGDLPVAPTATRYTAR